MLKCDFWGVRGSIACPGYDYEYYGGNTSCVSVSCDETLLIFDSGTGIKVLGDALEANNNYNNDVYLFFSHTHWDHINGFPFFSLLQNKQYQVTAYAGHLKPQGQTIEQVLKDQMVPPYFPVPLHIIAPTLQCNDITAGDTIKLTNDITIQTCSLNHPNEATAYRVNYQGKSLCYVTDTEHIKGSPDKNILALINGADLVIYDSSYDDSEFDNYIGWGHSTWQEGVRLCQKAEAKSLAIFHHSHTMKDEAMHILADHVAQTWPQAFLAREQTSITL